MTTLEALVAGMIWGALERSGLGTDTGGTVEVPGFPFPEDGTEAPAPIVILRTKGGAEVLITITETRTP